MQKITLQRLYKESGQTLIIAVSVLGLMLVLGFTLVGIVGTNLRETLDFKRRTVADQLAESGIKFVHQQMLESDLGADWRPPKELFQATNSKDPDTLYLRPSSGLENDLGGPDGLGPYSRIIFKKGRALIRVRLAENDSKVRRIFNTLATHQPIKKANGLIIIESIGRSGFIKTNDPTTLLKNAVTIKKYRANQSSQFDKDFEKIYRADANYKGQSKKYIGIASIGLLETARFITNKYHLSRPAELGTLQEDLGAYFGKEQVKVATVWGEKDKSASLWCNADLELYGDQQIHLDPLKNEFWAVAGKIKVHHDVKITTPQSNQTRGVEGKIPRTIRGALRRGIQGFDNEGYVHGISRKEPPSILRVNANTKQNRYRRLTQYSGKNNLGKYGFGEGIYIDCPERGAERNGGEALMSDWLNPGNSQSQGWVGPYYKPIATTIKLAHDGLDIIRDSRGKFPLWIDPETKEASDTSAASFWIENKRNNLVDQTTITDNIYATQRNFNGVIFCEGDIRIRGVIPTDVQMTIVSMGTIYIDGSITRGILKSNGEYLTRPSRSRLMLIAKDYVALNTTQFFASSPQQEELPLINIAKENGFELDGANKSMSLRASFLLRPKGEDPSEWAPYLFRYKQNSGEMITPWMMISHAPSYLGSSYLRMNVGPVSQEGSGIYKFQDNQRYFPVHNIQKNAFALYDSMSWGAGDRIIDIKGTNGTYKLGIQEDTEFKLSPGFPKGKKGLQNYRFSKMAIAPHDVRIEAGIYAENGCFFVIPGQWFNTNPQDTRQNFEENIANSATDQPKIEAQQKRYSEFGSAPEIPFYGEPLDVRITIFGSISENMPASMNHQAVWQRKWGWIPKKIGATETDIPKQHIQNVSESEKNTGWVPNIILSYDQAFRTFKTEKGEEFIRTNAAGDHLPPMPKLPVSPTLLYFGEAKK